MARTPHGRRRAESPAVAPCVPVAASFGDAQTIGTREDRMARFVAGSRFGRLLVICGLMATGWVLGLFFGGFGADPAAAEAHIPAGGVPVAEVMGAGAVATDTNVQPVDAEGVGDTGYADVRIDGIGQASGADAGGMNRIDVGDVHKAGQAVDAAGDGRLGKRRVAYRSPHSSRSHVAPGPASAGGFPTASDSALADAGAMAGRSVDGLTSQSGPGLPTPSTADHSAGANGFVPRGGGSGPSGSGLGDVARFVLRPRLTVAPAHTASAPAPVVRTAADDPSFSPD